MKYYIFNQATEQWSEQAYSLEVLKAVGLNATNLLGRADDSGTVITYIDALNQESLQEKKEPQQSDNTAELEDRVERLYTYRIVRCAVKIWLFITFSSVFASILLYLMLGLRRSPMAPRHTLLVILLGIGVSCGLSIVIIAWFSNRVLKGLKSTAEPNSPLLPSSTSPSNTPPTSVLSKHSPKKHTPRPPSRSGAAAVVSSPPKT